MKLVFDERVKHRLIGLAVIVSIAAIFTPAMVRKSNQKLDEQMQLSVRIPPKPTLPRVVMPDEEAMFKQAKVVHLDIPNPPEKPLLILAKAAPLHASEEEQPLPTQEASALNKEPSQAQKKTKEPNRPEKNGLEDKTAPTLGPSVQTSSPGAKTSTHASLQELQTTQTPTIRKKASLAVSTHQPREKTLAKSQQKIASKSFKNTYGIQVASFMNQKNAIAMTAKLRAQGYPTSYQTIQTNEGPRYKVIVGQVMQKDQAKLLQKQLASTLQLNGMIISGVS